MGTQLDALDSSGSFQFDATTKQRTAARRQQRTRREPDHARPAHQLHNPAPDQVHNDSALDPDGEGHHDEDVWAGGLDWPVVLWISIAHVGAVGAFFFFTWKAVALFVALFWLTGALGVCMGYHRLLTHGSFTTYRPVRWLFALLGGLSGEGSAITWVSTHRKHHAHSDKEEDPHSPRNGGLWAHFLWLMPNHGAKHHQELSERFAPDLLKDPMMRFLHSTFLLWHWVLGGVLFYVGWYFWDQYTGWSFVFWGVFLRMVYVLHATWFVNSATHMWGYRNYQTSDDSTNLWWVALLAFGEGWHNNHHAYQRMARHGHRWWEIDVTYWGICALEKLGLAWNVVHKAPAHQKPA